MGANQAPFMDIYGPNEGYLKVNVSFHDYRHLYISIATAVKHVIWSDGHPTSAKRIPCSAYINTNENGLRLFPSMNGLI